jgi:citrate synthase
MPENSLTVTDNRTGEVYQIHIEHGTIRALDLRQVKTNKDEFGLMSYDPGYTNTASTKSTITYIDGDNGILRYRGYPIEQLAENSSFLEVCDLILFGELPSRKELSTWENEISEHTFLHERLTTLMRAFPPDAHPTGMFTSTVGALSTFYPDAQDVDGPRGASATDQALDSEGPQHCRVLVPPPAQSLICIS